MNFALNTFTPPSPLHLLASKDAELAVNMNSKMHKNRAPRYTAEWPCCEFAIPELQETCMLILLF